MKEAPVKPALHAVASRLERKLPGRAFLLIVFPATPSQQAHYVANAPRSLLVAALTELTAAGLPGLADTPRAKS